MNKWLVALLILCMEAGAIAGLASTGTLAELTDKPRYSEGEVIAITENRFPGVQHLFDTPWAHYYGGGRWGLAIWNTELVATALGTAAQDSFSGHLFYYEDSDSFHLVTPAELEEALGRGRPGKWDFTQYRTPTWVWAAIISGAIVLPILVLVLLPGKKQGKSS